MLKRIAIATALAASGTAWGGTVIGGATLLDTATVISGTVSPTTFLTYVSGGNGATGNADGTSYNSLGLTPAAAIATADHQWLQYDAPIVMFSGVALNTVLAIPAIDHGWTTGNTTEFWEPFEFIIWGCGSAVFASTACEEGRITTVWTRGVDDTGPMKNADDWTTQWSFNGSYNYFAISSGDRLDHGNGTRGAYSPGEGEIDALAMVPGIPEPETYALFAAGLGLLSFVARRRKTRQS